jgi:kynurenine 3-monooxygenase
MNAGFEDCTILNRLMQENNDDFEKIFSAFTAERKPAGDAILELALRNYIEMRDKTADKEFLLQKKIEARFSAKYPDKWIPLYSQVTFSHIPYHEALSNGDRQQHIMDKIMARADIETTWDSEEVEQEILKSL